MSILMPPRCSLCSKRMTPDNRAFDQVKEAPRADEGWRPVCLSPAAREGSSFKRTQENLLTNRSLRRRARLDAHRADTTFRYTGP